MKETVYSLLKIYGLAVLLSTVMVFYFTFMLAFFFGLETGRFQVIVDINMFNEAWPEMIMLSTGMPIGLLILFKEMEKVIGR